MVCERGLALGRYMYMRSIAIWMPPSGELDGHEETIRRANTSSGRIGNQHTCSNSITAAGGPSSARQYLPMDQ